MERFENRSSQYTGDFERWLAENSADNSQKIRWLRRQLRAACRRELTPRQQEVIRLCYLDGLSVKEAAEQLGVEKSTVYRTLHRATGRLYRCLRYAVEREEE